MSYIYSDLRVNVEKSNVFLSGSCNNKEVISAQIGFNPECSPCKYLGLPQLAIAKKGCRL